MIRGSLMLSFVYRQATRDYTHNFDLPEACLELVRLLHAEFNYADLFSSDAVFYLKTMKSGRQKFSRHEQTMATQAASLMHDRETEPLLGKKNPVYLYELGITGRDGNVKKDMQHKFRQMNHYVRLLDGILKEAVSPEQPLRIADMGCGKGYLTFALYEHLINTRQGAVEMTGVEQRPELVEKANRIASACGFAGLRFVSGLIETFDAAGTDMLVALHACDTATDEAIAKGIRASARIIVVAPCCHKQIRKELKAGCSIEGITRHGILLERQAELLTDSLRALLLERQGYRTKVFEFIETEHTPKNVMIAAVRTERPEAVRLEAERRLKELKGIFGIGTHRLEQLLARV
jgi:SAM-dependent methyltransferase